MSRRLFARCGCFSCPAIWSVTFQSSIFRRPPVGPSLKKHPVRTHERRQRMNYDVTLNGSSICQTDYPQQRHRQRQSMFGERSLCPTTFHLRQSHHIGPHSYCISHSIGISSSDDCRRAVITSFSNLLLLFVTCCPLELYPPLELTFTISQRLPTVITITTVSHQNYECGPRRSH